MIGPSPFHAWGWPWHGLCVGATVSGHTVNQPDHGSAWLLDLGLPAVTLTAEETTEAATMGYTWLNYAMISGGYLYDTWLGADTFVHVDDAGECWLVSLSYGVPGTNTLRVTADVVRFGVFGQGLATPFSMSVDVACAHIELSTATGNPVNNYDRRVIALEDVWTNGARALVGVVLQSGSGASTENDLFSVVEISLSGEGNGAGLTLTGVEVLGQSALTRKFSDNGINDGINVGAGMGAQWYGDFIGGGDSLIQGYFVGGQWARAAHFDSNGNPQAYILRVIVQEDHWITGTSGVTCVDCGYSTFQTCEADVSAAGIYAARLELLRGATVVDHLSATVTRSGTQHQYNNQCAAVFTATGYCADDGPAAWSGSLAAHFDAADAPSFGHAAVSSLIAAWRAYDPHQADANVLIGAVRLGLQRIDAKAAALYKTAGTPGARTYGTIATPLGNKTYSGSASSNLYFAWQRMTGAFSFSTSPICYV